MAGTLTRCCSRQAAGDFGELAAQRCAAGLLSSKLVGWGRSGVNAFDEEPAEVPMPEGSGIKEVYAFFGLCAYQAQVLERGVINLAVGLHAKRLSSIAPEAVEPMFDRAEQKNAGSTLGGSSPANPGARFIGALTTSGTPGSQRSFAPLFQHTRYRLRF